MSPVAPSKNTTGKKVVPFVWHNTGKSRVFFWAPSVLKVDGFYLKRPSVQADLLKVFVDMV